MGFLDSMLGSAVGAGLITAVNSLVEKHGGVQGLVNELQQKGLGPAVKSWVGPGENQQVSPEDLHQALGADTMRDLAAKAGMTPEELAAKLAQFLPGAVDKMTPNGQVSQ
jgi:uncharacterized protein YidB (DUF937 family)